jgi:hypothetical protein
MNTATYMSDRCRACGELLSQHTMWQLRKCAADLDDAPERKRLEQRLRSYILEKASE